MLLFAAPSTEGIICALFWIVAIAVTLTLTMTRGLPALWRLKRAMPRDDCVNQGTANNDQPQGPASQDQPSADG